MSPRPSATDPLPPLDESRRLILQGRETQSKSEHCAGKSECRPSNPSSLPDLHHAPREQIDDLSRVDGPGRSAKYPLLNSSKDFGSKTRAAREPAQESDVEAFAKSVRTLRKTIENVLLKRTQLLYEYQQLHTHRKHLRNSLEALTISLPTQQEDLPKTLFPTSTRRKKRKDKAEAVESRRLAKSVSNTSSDEATSKKQSDGDDQEDADGVGEQHLPVNTANEYEDKYKRYMEAHRSFCTQEDIVIAKMEDLNNQEFWLSERLSSITKSMHDPGFADSLRTEMLDEDRSVSETGSHTSAPSDTPQLLKEYFSQQGDVGILMERIQELDYSHEEGRQARAFILDRGEPLEVSDADFERNHQIRLLQLEEELEDAERDAGVLEFRCINAGLNINAYRTAPPSVYTGSVAFASPDDDEYSEGPQIREIRPALKFAPLGATRSQRVGNWLRNVASASSIGQEAAHFSYDSELPSAPRTPHPST